MPRALKPTPVSARLIAPAPRKTHGDAAEQQEDDHRHNRRDGDDAHRRGGARQQQDDPGDGGIDRAVA